ncbi:hypothetical protein PIB30_059818 [Stylosanthes scabra]|uniref:PB1-like domain-containing protein n=1 Tax=Stylosanthes scabra TaxID=79078 RepID=A0ABU6RK98_9FABA|nr:hypothetical protein [Stylosanthes scabra]
MDEVITFVYHHGGKLVTKDDGEVVYEMGEITVIEDQEVDKLDVFWIRNFHKEIGYDQIEECYWLVPCRPLSIGLMVLATDAELLEMCFYAERNGRRIHIYNEHGVSVPNPVDEICPDLIEFPPSTMPDQGEIPTPVVVDVDLVSHANATPQKCASAKSAKPKLTQPKTVKPNSAKPTSVKPNPAKPKTVQPKSSQPCNKSGKKPNSSKSQTRSATRVSPRKGKKVVTAPIGGDDGSSGSDSYDSAEDEMYTPKADDEDDFIVTQARKKDWKRKQGAGINLKKAREEIMLEDDGLMVDSDSDVDLGEVFGNNTNAVGDDAINEAYDAHSDGNDS